MAGDPVGHGDIPADESVGAGDVGSGKTVVALHALVMACGSGCQASLMVPTEILAEQHYLTLKPLLESVGLNAVLLTSSGKTKARHAVLQQLSPARRRWRSAHMP